MSLPVARAARVAATGLVFLGLSACGGESAGTAGEGSEASGATAAAETSGAGSCVADYADSPCSLLTAELARREFPQAPADLEPEVAGSVCELSWESERTRQMDVGSRTMEVPDDDQLSLGWIETYQERPAEQFRRAYLPTQEEMERGAEMMQEEFEERAEERGLSESQEEAGQELGEAVASGNRFEPVDAVGDQASWNARFNELNVLQGNAKFRVAARVSASEEENRQAAVDLAKAVMAACR
jgi:hypothetical protein